MSINNLEVNCQKSIKIRTPYCKPKKTNPVKSWFLVTSAGLIFIF